MKDTLMRFANFDGEGGPTERRLANALELAVGREAHLKKALAEMVAMWRQQANDPSGEPDRFWTGSNYAQRQCASNLESLLSGEEADHG